MAEYEPVSEEVEEEKLPTLASLLQPPPSPGETESLSSASPAPKAATAAGVVVVSSESESEEVEVVEIDPLPERIKRRVETKSKAVCEPLQPGGWDATSTSGGLWEPQDTLGSSEDESCGTRGVERPSLCPLSASQSDSADRSLVSGPSPGTSPPPKKSKYSEKEREETCGAAQERKEREARRRKQEEEKKKRKALAQMLKAQRPGECQKYITVVLDPAVLQVEGGEQILSALQAANYSSVIEDQTVPCSISWRRKAVSFQMGEEDKWTEEPNVLVLLRLEEFLSMVHNCKQEARGYAERREETLQSFVAHLMEKIPGKVPLLAVVGVENYFRSLRAQPKMRLQQSSANRKAEEEQRKRKVKSSVLELTRKHVEEALVDLHVNSQIQVTCFESWKELTEFATSLTKAVAEAPFKRQQAKTELPFYLEKGCRRGVRTDPSGNSIFELWKRQIQQFNRISLEMAEAIASAYPSPQLLIQAYNKCSSEQERENMLANILVQRGDGVTATSQRLGPEHSRRIYVQMTCLDPDRYLNFTG